MARLSLSLLGPFKATLDGTPVTGFPSAKVRALLVYLAVESDRPHPREVLAGLLWPDYPERSANTNLSNALSHLRTTLHDREAPLPCLAFDRETVQFNPESDCWVDVLEFESELRVAGCESRVTGGGLQATQGQEQPDEIRHLQPGTHNSKLETPYSQLETCVSLYRGPFLEGFTLKDSPPFEQWALVTRERLQRQVMEALARLSAYDEQRGEYRQALAHARQQLDLEPWREGAHRQAMRALALSGQRDAALAQYEACVRALREELDVEPAPETTELYQAIRANQPLLPTAPVLDTRPSELPPARAHNLPAQATAFVGRERELDELSRLLADPQVRLVTVVGPGGSGKTRLALEAASRQVGRYEHGVWFASLAALQSVESIVPAVAQAVGFQFYPGGDPRQQLLDYLREKHVLLVLDNWEHLLEGANLVADLLAVAPRVQVLATSRARLNLQGEQGFHLEGMRVPAEVATEDASQYSAVQLFLQSARRVRSDLHLEDELGPVVHLCRLVEGMPLALVLAAAWVEMLSPAEIAAEVERSLDFLAAEWRDLPERQRSVRAVFDHSWRLLSERQQAVFAALAVFRGGFTREAAEQVAGADLRALVSLMNKSFLERDAGGRYQMHELLRQYGEEKLDRSPDGGQATRDRHAAYYAAALERWAAELKGPRQQAALAEVDVEIGNARAAWEWALARGQVEWLSQGIEGLGWFYAWRGRYEEGEAIFRTMADRMAAADGGWETAPADRQRVLARLWAWQSHLSVGQTERDRKLLRQSLDLLEGLESAGCDVRLERAFAVWQEALIEVQYRLARPLLEHSLSLYRSLGARWETASVLGRLAGALQDHGFYDQAEKVQREVLALHRELGDQHGIIEALGGLGWRLLEQGDFGEAERLQREGLALAGTMGDSSADAAVGSLVRLYYILAYQGRFVEARSLAEDAMVYRRQNRSGLGRVFMEIGWLELHLGRYAEARLFAQRGLPVACEIDSRYQIGFALLTLGWTAMAEGDHAEAGQRIRESLDTFREIENWALVIWALAALAGVALLEGDFAAAQQHLRRALHMVTERRSFTALLPALSFLARLLAEQGQAERAVEIYALASRYPHVANSRWYADLVGQRIAEVAAALPPEVVAAAQELGRARDVWATAEELAAELEG